MKILAYNFRQILLISFSVVLLICLYLPSGANAGTTNKKNPNAKLSSLPVEKERLPDPETDPLPEWLILPDGTSESKVQITPSKTPSYKVVSVPDNQDNAGKWLISVHGDGDSIRYVYKKSNKTLFSVLTTADYPAMIVYDQNNKKLKKVSADDFFDDSKPLSFNSKKLNFSGVGVANAAAGCYQHGINCPQKVRKNVKLSKRQLNKLAHKAGIKNNNSRRVAVAIAQAESGGRVGEVLCNARPPFNPKKKFEIGVRQCKNNSADRGVWQINNKWHKNVKNKCAFSPRCNAKAMFNISSHGTNFTPWSTYENKLYRRYL